MIGLVLCMSCHDHALRAWLCGTVRLFYFLINTVILRKISRKHNSLLCFFVVCTPSLYLSYPLGVQRHKIRENNLY